jgi:hypothetical protein
MTASRLIGIADRLALTLINGLVVISFPLLAAGLFIH